MKNLQRLILFLFASILLSITSFAQKNLSGHRFNRTKDAPAKIAPLFPSGQQLNGHQPGNTIQTLWDINLTFDVIDQTGISGWAGIVYANGQYFCSKWNGIDTLAIFDSTGNFQSIVVIPGIGAVRGMTYDGTYIYAANLTRNIQVIDPVALTRVRQHTVATTVGNVRWITYNPSGNSGSGSFFVGSFNTAIFQVRKPPAATVNMATINSIPASVHGLSGMYGVAYEDLGADSKFWVFAQSQPEGNAVVVQLNNSGVPTGVRRNTDLDLSPGGLAGGIYLGRVGGFPDKTLVCLNQGRGVLGYDIKVPAEDAQFDSIGTANGYTAWPKNWNVSTSIIGKVRSSGSAPINNFSPVVKILDAESQAIIQSLETDTISILPGEALSFQSVSISPELYSADVLYEVLGLTNFPGDQIAGNDTASTFFAITDSTLAQDFIFFNPNLSASIGIAAAASEEKSVGARFNLPFQDTLTSVSYFLDAPFEGQETSVSVFPFENGVPSPTPIATSSAVYTPISDDGSLNDVTVTLPLDAPLILPAGDYIIAVNELGDSSCGIGSIIRNFKPKTFYVKWNSNNAGQWSDLGNFPAGLRRAIAIYPNFGVPQTITKVSGSILSPDMLQISPNPVNNRLSLITSESGLAEIRVLDLLGKEQLTQKMSITSGINSEIPVDFLKPGCYQMEFRLNQMRFSRKFIKN